MREKGIEHGEILKYEIYVRDLESVDNVVCMYVWVCIMHIIYYGSLLEDRSWLPDKHAYSELKKTTFKT